MVRLRATSDAASKCSAARITMAAARLAGRPKFRSPKSGWQELAADWRARANAAQPARLGPPLEGDPP
jgi:hypothetical protein